VLRRAGCWITSSGGDPKDSATEIYRQNSFSVHNKNYYWVCSEIADEITERCGYLVRVERRGKSSPAFR